MKSETVLCLNPQGYHRVAYQQWGDQDNPNVVICVHGLVRNSRDFDDLARSLSSEYRVVCPDIVGRGQSDWLPKGVAYSIPQYCQDMVTLIARLNVEKVDWIGTSMGGLIGMGLAAYAHSPIKRMALNDIGAFIPREALQRIGSYVGLDQRFASVDDIEALYRQNYLAYRGLSDEQWQHIAHHGSRPVQGGQFALHYDPVIGDYAKAMSEEDVDLWALWKAVNCPQLLLWGETSDVLKRDTVEQMQRINTDLVLKSWPGIGHAPSLMEQDQIDVIVNWLNDA